MQKASHYYSNELFERLKLLFDILALPVLIRSDIGVRIDRASKNFKQNEQPIQVIPACGGL